SGQYVCLAERWWEGQQEKSRYHLIDVSIPAEPRRLGGLTTDGGLKRVAWSGQYVYVTAAGWDEQGSRAWLDVINVIDPVNPLVVGKFETAGDFSGVAVSGQYACVMANGEAGLQVIDTSDPARPRKVGS